MLPGGAGIRDGRRGNLPGEPDQECNPDDPDRAEGVGQGVRRLTDAPARLRKSHHRKPANNPTKGRQPAPDTEGTTDRCQQHVVRPWRHGRDESEDGDTDELLQRHALPQERRRPSGRGSDQQAGRDVDAIPRARTAQPCGARQTATSCLTFAVEPKSRGASSTPEAARSGSPNAKESASARRARLHEFPGSVRLPVVDEAAAPVEVKN